MLTKALLISALGLSATLSAATYQWDANGSTSGLGGDGNWVDANWDNTASGANDGTETPVAYTFTTADTALFGGTAGTVTVAAGTVAGGLKFTTSGYTLTGGAIALDTTGSSASNYAGHDIIIGAGNTATINSNLSNTGTNSIYFSSGVSTANGGTVILGGTNTFTNDVYACGITLEINNFSALGFGGSTSRGLTLRNWEIGATGVTTLRYTGATTTFSNYSNSNGWLVGSGKFVFDVTQAGTVLTLDRAIASNNNVANTLEKTGAGTLTLAGGNNYSNTAGSTTGGTIITGGTLNVTGSLSDTGFVTVDGPSSIYTVGANDTIGTLTVKNGATVNGSGILTPSSIAGESGTISVAIAGSGALTKTTSGILTLSNAGSSFTGNVTVSAGTLRFGAAAGASNGVLGALNSAVTKVNVASGATVDFNGYPDNTYGYTIAGTGVGGAGALINTGAGIGTGSKQAVNVTLAADASIGGSGDWALLAANHGATNLDLAGFTLTKVGSNTVSLDNTTITAGNIIVSTGGLRLGVNSGGSGSAISGGQNASFTVNGGTLYADQRSATIGSLSGTGGAVNIGSGLSLTVGELNTSTAFAGVVSGAGALTKNGTGTLTLSGANTYTGATTISAGKLAVTGTILVNAAGGVTIASGAELALSGTLKLNSASASLVNSGTLTAGGILDLGGLFDSYNGGANGSYNLISGTAASGAFSSIQGFNSSVWQSVSFDSATGNLNFTAVPEPSAYGLLGAGALAFVAFVRRRRNSAR